MILATYTITLYLLLIYVVCINSLIITYLFLNDVNIGT